MGSAFNGQTEALRTDVGTVGWLAAEVCERVFAPVPSYEGDLASKFTVRMPVTSGVERADKAVSNAVAALNCAMQTSSEVDGYRHAMRICDEAVFSLEILIDDEDGDLDVETKKKLERLHEMVLCIIGAADAAVRIFEEYALKRAHRDVKPSRVRAWQR